MLIGFEEIYREHSRENFSKIIRLLLESYNIHDRLFTLTSNNARNNRTLTRAIEKALKDFFTIT